MGKWCTVTLPNNFAALNDALKLKSDAEINQLWLDQGSKPLSFYGLQWYRGSSGGGWMCIDDSTSSKVFKMFVDDVKMPSYQDRYEQQASVLAYQLGMGPSKPAMIEWEPHTPTVPFLPQELEFLKMFEDILANDPTAYAQIGQVVYQATMQEVLEFANKMIEWKNAQHDNEVIDFSSVMEEVRKAPLPNQK